MAYIIIEWVGKYSGIGIALDLEGEPLIFDDLLTAQDHAKETCQEYKIVKLD